METTNKQYYQFGHEKFEAYQISVQFLGISHKIAKAIPPGNHHLLDQLKRAALSISLNIAEGSGKMSEAEKRRFYSIARGSTMECAAILDALGNSKDASPSVRTVGFYYLRRRRVLPGPKGSVPSEPRH